MVCAKRVALGTSAYSALESIALVDRASPLLVPLVQGIAGLLLGYPAHPMPMILGAVVYGEPLRHTLPIAERTMK